MAETGQRVRSGVRCKRRQNRESDGTAELLRGVEQTGRETGVMLLDVGGRDAA